MLGLWSSGWNQHRLLQPDARIMVLWRSAAAPPHSPKPYHSIFFHTTSKGASEISLPQECIKYAVVSGSEVVV